ncbi:uncharacterized protein LOC134259168 [Saccostrea cucullata]|uniref:uncharacterized protein LOC134259168 n=1 Tax=Saccostrea cuccullata TaxID=36930 RepID=UPI002ED05B93
MYSLNGEPYCLYGDAAYAVNQYVLGPVKGIREHCDQIINRITEIKRTDGDAMKNNLNKANAEVLDIDYRNKCISSLYKYGYLSTIVSTKPLTPGGICLSSDGGLLVTLTDELSDTFKLQPCSRRLVRHLKINGDLIHDYEYQEDGQTRIFVQPTSVAQNGNGDICVLNQSGDKTGELVLLSFSGRTKSVYGGRT